MIVKEMVIAVVGLLLLGAVWTFWQSFEAVQGDSPTQIVCTMEAKLCPDGSSVGRSGPRCEFAPCPSPKPDVFQCAEGKSITATFTGDVVEFYVSDGRSRTFSLSRTTSADAVEQRFSNLDNSTVLWVKDSSAFLEENGKTTFASCVLSPNDFPDSGGPQSESGTIFGTVTLGPRCPVMRDPPDPACADTLYQTALVLTSANGERVIRTFSSSKDGTFSLVVPPGDYEVHSGQKTPVLPRCSSTGYIHVEAGKSVTLKVQCDTGIR